MSWRAALSQPRRCHSSWPGAWASVSMLTLQLPLEGLLEQPVGRVLALGAAVDLDRGVEPGAGREHDLGVEGRFGPHELGVAAHLGHGGAQLAAGAVARGCRRVGWPRPAPGAGSSTVRSIRSFEWALATTTSSSASRSLVLVERAVLEDVHLDAGQDAERGQALVEGPDLGQLLAEARRR